MPIHSLLKKWLLLPFVTSFVSMPGQSCRYPELALSAEEKDSCSRLRQHIVQLSEHIGERNWLQPANLQAAADYICQSFRANGYQVTTEALALENNHGSNIIAELPGSTRQIFVIGAHYDTVPGSPGANDNASGVAAMLEIARQLRHDKPNATIRFVAFANEEHRDQPAEAMGSYIHAQDCRRRGEDIIGMWSLETLGYYSNSPNSQHYPDPFNLFYPRRGNFIAFVGDEKSRTWVHRSIKIFRKLRAFPSEGLAAPQKFKDVGRSDHWGFWQAGYQALMVTDTANFRYAQYHTHADLPSIINYDALTRVTSLLAISAKALSK